MNTLARKCVLINRRTKEELVFPTICAAAKFLDRDPAYIRNAYTRAGTVCAKDDGDRYDLDIIGTQRKYSMTEFNRSKQICFDCKKAVGGCSWSKNFTPVQGWVAEPTKIRQSGGQEWRHTTASYRIISCPEFEHD